MGASRKNLSKRVRFEIFKRDDFTCQYCGAHPPQAILHVDHIFPASLGGTNDEINLLTACDGCNVGKGAVPLSVVPISLKDRAAEVEEREAQLAGYAAVMESARERLEQDTWRVADALQTGASNGYSLSKFNSIKNFVEKLGVHDTLRATEIAWARKPYSDHQRFKYFCGVCWTMIRDGGAI